MMNQKGFAVSTILYGILIMAMLIMTLLIGTMAFTKKSTTDLVGSVEEDLNKCVNPDSADCTATLP